MIKGQYVYEVLMAGVVVSLWEYHILTKISILSHLHCNLHCCIVGTLLLSLPSHHLGVWHIVRREDVTVGWRGRVIHVPVEERRLFGHPDAGGVAGEGGRGGAGGGGREVCWSPRTGRLDHVSVLLSPVRPSGQLQHSSPGLRTVLLGLARLGTKLTLLESADYATGNDQQPNDRDQDY